MDKRINGTIGIAAAALLALSLGSCANALKGGEDLPAASASGLDKEGNPITVEMKEGTLSMEPSAAFAETLVSESSDPESAAFASILEGKLSGKLTGDEAADKEAFLAALAEAQAEYAASLVPVPAPRATYNDAVPNLKDKQQYFDAFEANAKSGDINIYWDSFPIGGHSSIWDARRRMFLHSGGGPGGLSASTSSVTDMTGGANYYVRNVIQGLVGGWEARMVRVNYGGSRDAVSNAIESVYYDTRSKGYLVHDGRDDYSKGTYCNQIPYLAWRRMGVNIADGKLVQEPKQVYSHTVTTTHYFMWWSWQTTTPVYVTVMVSRFEPYNLSLPFYGDKVLGDQILNDNDTAEILRSKAW